MRNQKYLKAVDDLEVWATSSRGYSRKFEAVFEW